MTKTNRTTWLLAGAATLTATIVACGGGDSRNRVAIRNDKAPVEASAAGQQVKPYPPPQAGTITGTVKWDGKRPDLDLIDVSGNAECTRATKEKIYYEKLVVNQNNTVKFCLLSLDLNDVYAAPSEPALIDQVGCHYVPHVMAVVAGQKLNIRNSDPGTQHNVHYMAINDGSNEDNFSMAVPGIRAHTFTDPDMIKFKCDVHPWMGAWCAVKSHPFFAVTGDDGTYTIKNAPAGKQKLVLHHEKLGDQTVEVEVEAGKTVTKDFTLTAK